MAGAGHKRDPVSELFDAAARRLLERAHERRGQWVSTRLGPPSPRHVALFATLGINVLAADELPGGAARTRWARGFVRAVHFQRKWFTARGGAFRDERRMVPFGEGALEVEVGRWLPATGAIPAGRVIRARIRPGGQAALGAVRRKADSARIYDDRGSPAGRWSDPARRDWE